MPNIPRRDELNHALELMHFGFRKMVQKPDELLDLRGMGRVHHRLLYFIARNDSLSVGDLQDILGISKQALHRPLSRLTEQRLVVSKSDADDGRVRRLSLSRKGRALECRLSRMQRSQFRKVFDEAGPEAEHHWREVMKLLANRVGEK